MTIKAIRDTLAAAIDDITGLKVYATVPLTPNEFPCVIIKPGDSKYDDTLSGDGFTSQRSGEDRLPFELWVLLAIPGSADEGQDSLDDYLEPTGSSSIRQKVNAVSGARCLGWHDYGIIKWGDEAYLGAILDVEVLP